MKKNRAETFAADKTSKSGEMIPSMFNWVTPDIQAKISNHLAKVTKNETSEEIAKKAH
jgi:hypothetical protein